LTATVTATSADEDPRSRRVLFVVGLTGSRDLGCGEGVAEGFDGLVLEAEASLSPAPPLSSRQSPYPTSPTPCKTVEVAAVDRVTVAPHKPRLVNRALTNKHNHWSTSIWIAMAAHR
jgi:hypothetical protein